MWPDFSIFWLAFALSFPPYVPPALEPEPPLDPPELATVEIVPANGDWDARVFARPSYKAPLVGHVASGARVRVRGEHVPLDGAYCETGRYYAIEPFGWICSADAEPTPEPITTASVLQVPEGGSLPHRYVIVIVPEGETLPMWGSETNLRAGTEPDRVLGRGDTIAVRSQTLTVGEARYYVTIEGQVIPVSGTTAVTRNSEWQGVELDGTEPLPFGWVTRRRAPIYDAPAGAKVAELERRARVDILEEVEEKKRRWLRVGEGQWLRADHVNEVRTIERPEGTGSHRQWIDVDLGEQVVVAYEDEQPVYATLTSSGRGASRTPRGNYPVWGKASAITMSSQPYDDKPYYVDRVPWVLFFQAHNALHGAYWHDLFGVTKSHGCANLAPRDARYLFEWLEPPLPPGWTAVRYWNLNEAPVVHVRNSALRRPFFQERNIGPPNVQEERARLEQAEARRAEELRVLEERFKAEELVAPGLPARPLPLLPPAPVL